MQVYCGLGNCLLSHGSAFSKNSSGVSFFIYSAFIQRSFSMSKTAGDLEIPGNLEDFGKLGKGKELALRVFALRAPAEQRHIVENCRCEIALRNQVLVAGVAVRLDILCWLTRMTGEQWT